MARKSLHERVAALPLLLPQSVRGYLRTIYKAIVPQPTFVLEQAIHWLIALKDAGIVFGFPDDLRGASNRLTALAILKHDIHDNLDRAVDMARAEHAQSIPGLYFMMGPHALNRRFYGSPRAWEQLREIQSLGHRIGLHLDAFDALQRGGLHEFVAGTLADFSREGIRVRYANSHGDRIHGVRRAEPADLFAELADLRRGATGPAAGTVAGRAREYSLKHLANQFGLTYWVDGRVMREGKPLRRMLYVSDNEGRIRIGSRNLSSKPFEIDADFVVASVRLLSTARCLILLHPQWYVSRQ